MNLPSLHIRRLFSVALAAAMLAACSIWPVEKRVLSGNERIRVAALKTIRALPMDERAGVIAAMIGAISSQDDRITNRAAEALVACGSAAVDPVIAKLGSTDPYLRTISVAILGDIGAPVPKIGPALVAALEDPHPLVREEAAHALSRLGPSASGAVPALYMTLNDADPDVRDAVQAALKRLGATVPAAGAPAKSS